MSRNAAYQPTVAFLPELEPTIEAKHLAIELYEQQTGHMPSGLYLDLQSLGIWGVIGPDAVLLFKTPQKE